MMRARVESLFPYHCPPRSFAFSSADIVGSGALTAPLPVSSSRAAFPSGDAGVELGVLDAPARSCIFSSSVGACCSVGGLEVSEEKDDGNAKSCRQYRAARMPRAMITTAETAMITGRLWCGEGSGGGIKLPCSK